MPDSSYLSWPFLDTSHRDLKADLDGWCESNASLLDVDVEQENTDLDLTCRGLVKLLGKEGWLTHAVPDLSGDADQRLDVRSLCLLRETLAFHSGQADFCLVIAIGLRVRIIISLSEKTT